MSLTNIKYNTDKYTWQAVYSDGTSLWECDANQKSAQGHPIIVSKYDQIDRDKITKFNVYETEKLGTKDLKPVISLDIKSGYRLIWRKRRFQRVIGPQVPFMTVYLVGWQATIYGQNVQSIIYLYEDGKMEMSSQKSDYELFNFETETP